MEEMKNDVTEVAEVVVPEAEEAYKSGSVQYIDSREVAEIVGKEHSMLLRDIRRYIEQLGQSKIAQSDFFTESTYRNSQNKTQPCYLVTKKGCEFIAHKLTGIKGTKFTATYINRFHEMEDTLEKNELTSLEKLVRQQAEVIGNMQELVQDIVQKQNSVEQENTGNKRFNPYGADSTVELEERKKELYSLSARVGELWNMSQSKVLHYLYLTMEEKLNLTLNAYKSVYVSETGNEEASMVEVIAADNRLYQTAARMNREAIERKQIYG